MVAASTEINYSDPDLLRQFYAEIFPSKDIIEWLSYNNPKNLKTREFSFTFANGSYLRFQSFNEHDQLKDFLLKNTPVKMDLGAIYSSKPSDRKTAGNFRPLERELIFDLDMTDYDEVRTCCTGKSVCEKCWKFLACAMKIIDCSLEEDFGYEKRVWVFSGRRGIHCWVGDERARKLNPNHRKALVNFFEEQNKSLAEGATISKAARSNHPFFKRSLIIMHHFFTTYVLVQQNVIDKPEVRSKLLLLLDEKLINSSTTALIVWREAAASAHPDKEAILNSIIMHYMLPRIDSHVSIQLNHLLKLPFCIHPDTGKICVPVDSESVEDFDPNSVPNLLQLLQDKKLNGRVDIGLDIFKKFYQK